MKNVKFLFFVILTIFSSEFVHAQWAGSLTTTGSIFRSGNVGVGVTTPADTRYSIYGFTPSTVSGNAAVFGDAARPTGFSSWIRGVRGDIESGYGYAIGVQGTAYTTTPSNDGRAYGVFAQAGNASNNYNYAFYGQLIGSNNGAAVVGHDRVNYSGWSGNTQGSWASYFIGNEYVSEKLSIGTHNTPYRLNVQQVTNQNTPIAQLSDSDNRRIFLVPRLGGGGYTLGSHANDAGLFWSDNAGQNNSAGFIIAPHKGSWASLRLGAEGKMLVGGGSTNDKLQVGLGTARLGIGSSGGADLDWGTSYIGFNATRGASGWLFENDGANNGGGVIYTNIGGTIYFANEMSTGATNKTFSDSDVFDKVKMKITSEGKVAIGQDVQIPGKYKLYVQDGILTEKIKVAIHGSPNWADYVFEEDYELKSLEDVEDFIQENGHLHNIPSAQEIVKDGGFELKEMTTLQQEKIEEIFLHLIEMNNQIKELKLENERLRKAGTEKAK